MVALQDRPPEARDRAGHTGALIGGFAAVPEEQRVVVCCAIDNLLKGAASQALQNLNLALGFPEIRGVL
jgi:N-acetyl-gamma-glutamylphosphate reductase